MSQKNQIRRALEAGKKISPLTALRDFGCMRLSARILELRNEGMWVNTTWREQRGKRFAVYKLVDCMHNHDSGMMERNGMRYCRRCGSSVGVAE